MKKEIKTNSKQNSEIKKIKAVLKKYQAALGDFDIVPVGKAGYILQSKRQKHMAGNDWVFFDYDDTLAGTNEVKSKRLELYKQHTQDLGIQLTIEQADKIINITDKFMRWEENPGEGEIYHIGSHMLALQWATNTVKETKGDIDEAILNLESRLDRMKLSLTQTQKPHPSDPFHFSVKDKQFINRGLVKKWSKEIDTIIMQTIVNPPHYTETIKAAKHIGQAEDTIHKANIGIFTYGNPDFQLLKVFELLIKHPDFAVSQIWLTRRPKKDFIMEIIKTETSSMHKQDHVIILIDDSPKELSHILSLNDYLSENTKVSFRPIRSIRAGTKYQYHEWQVKTPFSQLDFISQSYAPEDILNTILANRYLGIKSKLGKHHPKTKKLQDHLIANGITDI